MFTGIIEELGEVTAWQQDGDAARLTVRAPLAASDAPDEIQMDLRGISRGSRARVMFDGGGFNTAPGGGTPPRPRPGSSPAS